MSSNRRTFLSGAVGLGVGGWALASCKDRTASESSIKSSSPTSGGVRVRRNVMSLKPNGPELNDYRTAIKAMTALGNSDHRSWEGQAQVHNNSCPHGSWFFLPWHRAYLMWFEQIIQKYSGNATWSLPYWDWTATPHLPPAFTDQSGDNPLFHAGRTASGDLGASIVGTSVITRLMGLTDFIAFGGSRGKVQRVSATAGMLEGTPHNGVHNYLGGDMGTFLSPRDPIFWLHHANVDRIWSKWSAQHATTALPGTPTAPAQRTLTRDFWLGFTMTGYFDLDGKPVTATPNDTLTTTGYGYHYDTAGSQNSALRLDDSGADGSDDGSGDSTATPTAAASSGPDTETTVLEVQTDGTQIFRSDPFVTFAVPVTSALRSAFEDYRAATLNNPESTNVRLYAENIPVPNDLSMAFRLFLNSPGLTPDSPDDSDYFVGRYAFFGPPHPDHGGVTRGVVFDLKQTFDKQFTSATKLGSELDFQVQLLGAPGTVMPPSSVFAGITLRLEFTRLS